MKGVRFPARVLDEVIASGHCELFLDEHGDERVRVTPKGMRAIGVSEAEISRMVEIERLAGRPYKAEA